MPEEIFQGHDCSKEAKVTTRTDKKTGKVTEHYRGLKLERTKIYAKPGELIILKLLHVHALCDDACYTWKIITGAGTLFENAGPQITYRAPFENKECENSAIIKVYCANKKLDTAYVTVSLYEHKTKVIVPLITEAVAFSIWSGEITFSTHTGSTYIDRYGKKQLSPEYLYSRYFRRYYDCDGNFLFKYPVCVTGQWTTTNSVAALKKACGHRVGEVVDYRTKKMKEEVCCPIALLEAEML